MNSNAISWKRNLGFAWLSQLLSIMGFSFAMPFVAYYIQKDLGIADPEDAKVWTGLFMIAAPFSLGFMAPIWGVIADRYGRKLMMLRANFGAAAVLVLMGMAPSVGFLVLLRFVQGAFTGTVTAAQALVACYTPERRHGLALGSMHAAIFTGMSLGNYAGGKFAHAYGYKNAFFASGAIVFVSALLVLFGVRERFERKPAPQIRSGRRIRMPSLGIGLPILGLILYLGMVREFDKPMLPFLVQEIHGQVSGSELWMSRVNVLFCLGAFASGFVIGPLADRFAAISMGWVCAIGAGLCVIPQALATSFAPLMISRVGMAFFAGGMDPVIQSWLSRVTPPDRRGAVFGWSVTAKSLGWVVGLSSSLFVGRAFGHRYAFMTMCFLYFAMIVVFRATAAVVNRMQANTEPSEEGEASEVAEREEAVATGS